MSAYSEGRRQANTPAKECSCPCDDSEKQEWWRGRRDEQAEPTLASDGQNTVDIGLYRKASTRTTEGHIDAIEDTSASSSDGAPPDHAA